MISAKNIVFLIVVLIAVVMFMDHQQEKRQARQYKAGIDLQHSLMSDVDFHVVMGGCAVNKIDAVRSVLHDRVWDAVNIDVISSSQAMSLSDQVDSALRNACYIANH